MYCDFYPALTVMCALPDLIHGRNVAANIGCEVCSLSQTYYVSASETRATESVKV